MLLGRDRELAFIGVMLDEARGGLSRSLIVHGDPGIGKTALLEEAVEMAVGFTVLRARPLEAESELPFAGLSDLLRPLLVYLDRIPGPQAAVLSGALALGPPTAGDRFTGAVATISLLAAGAEDAPVLVVVDDAHWLDTPSREALLFAAGRLRGDRVVLLLAMRDRPWREASRVEQVELPGLAAVDAVELIARSGKVVSRDVRDRLVAAIAGNPLALLEALSNLDDDQLAGLVPIVGPIGVGRILEASFALRLEPLPAATRRALVVAAVIDTGDIGEIEQALGGGEHALTVFDPAERLRLIAIRSGRLEFMHPLLRSVVYSAADPVERRWAHSAFADALGSDRHDQIAWHLAAAATGPDEGVAKLLEETARTALDRHGYIAAANALALAARLSPDWGDRIRRTLDAGHSFRLGGQAHAANDILVDVLDEVHDPLVRADIQLLRGSVLLMTSSMMDTASMLVDEADRVATHDPSRAASMLALASLGAHGAAEVRLAVEFASRAVRISQPIGGPVQMTAELVYSFALALAGRVGEARSLVEPMLPVLDLLDPLSEGGFLLVTAAHTFSWIEEWATARRIYERFIVTARGAGAITMLAHPLVVMAELELRCGRIAAAYSAATESAQISADIGEDLQGALALVTLARIEALLGLEAHCRGHVTDALDAANRLGIASTHTYAAAALGMLELSLGRPDRATENLIKCSQQERDMGVGLPNAAPWNGDLVESYVRLGRHQDAARELNYLEAQAQATGIRWAAATAARCRGLLAAEDDYARPFQQAIELHGDQDPYERARSQLCFGRRLRHSRHRTEALVELRRSLAQFESLGAELWAEQARIELRASGANTAASQGGSTMALTPQELHVALAVAGGATNKEAAAALFISTKTVEFHLSHIYRKLGLRSRSELARHIAGRAPRREKN